MTPLTILFSTLFIVFCAVLIYVVLGLFKRVQESSTGLKAKDIYVISYDDDKDEFETEFSYKSKQALKLMKESKTQQKETKQADTAKTSKEKREHPRTDFQSYVEFIKKGKLYKEASRDLSYSGIFLKTKTPENYAVNDSIMITFQNAEGRPQKRKGKIVRKDEEGIGIQFLKK